MKVRRARVKEICRLSSRVMYMDIKVEFDF